MSSVKVAVRVRPFNEREKGSKPCVVMVSFVDFMMNTPTNLMIITEWCIDDFG